MDQGFREQLMAVLQAGKALVSSGSQGGAPRPVFACICPQKARLLTGRLFFRVEWIARTTMRSWGMRP